MSPPTALLIYVLIPPWLAAGFADWLCHRRAKIETTSGARESVLHLVLLAEMGVPLLAALYLDVNALILGAMIAGFVVHEITAYVDVRYAAPRREVGVFEQCVHSVLEMSPLAVVLLLAAAHWPQALALVGLGNEAPRFVLVPSTEPPSATYTIALLVAIAVFAVGPYTEELVRGLRAATRAKPNAN